VTREETVKLLAFITAACPSLKATPATVEAWHVLLGDLPFLLVMQATVTVLAHQTGAWWPMPGAIRETALRLSGRAIPDGDQAWAEVTAAVRQYGYYAPDAALAALSPITRSVAQAIGWDAICLDDAEIVRGQFLRLYQLAADRARQTDVPPSGRALPLDASVVQSLLDRWQDRARRLGLPGRGPTHEA